MAVMSKSLSWVSYQFFGERHLYPPVYYLSFVPSDTAIEWTLTEQIELPALQAKCYLSYSAPQYKYGL